MSLMSRGRICFVRLLDYARFQYIYIGAIYFHGHLGRNMQLVSGAVVVVLMPTWG